MRRRVVLAGTGVVIIGLMRTPNPWLNGYGEADGYGAGGYGG